ncbi:filamentous hemagglutinin N-terminal domain-containing protein, partial [Opitutales bacterium]|nr:filamentous hemagglutinin N-terminal domain-containing protein [Opitutales bacterium]
MNYYKSLTHKLNSLYHTRYRGRINRLARRTGNTLKAGMMSIGLFGFVIGTPGAALAANLPTGAQVVSGNVNINQLSNDAMRIVQGSQSAIVNWQSFDIGHGALVDVVQPNVDAAMLSRVIGNNLSEIHGSLNANGQIFLINPNGILFGENAQVNVYSLIASTMDIADSDFLTGNIHFTGDSEASVINLGTINSESFTALIAGDVQNLGEIITPGGDAALLAGDAVIEVGEAAGGKITMDLSGLLGGSASNSGSIDASSADSTGGSVAIVGESVSNAGLIDASGATGGGEVLIGGDFQGKNENLSNAQNTVVSGSISADALENGDGGSVIVWSDGDTTFEGSISAKGGLISGDGGFVETSGKNIVLSGTVSTSSPNGQTGTYLIDPDDIEINTAANGNTLSGYSLITSETIDTSLDSNNLVISTATETGDGVTTDGGDLVVKGPVTDTSGNKLTLIATDQIRTTSTGTINLTGDLELQAGNGGISVGKEITTGGTLTTNSVGSQSFTKNLTANALNLTTTADGSGVDITKYQGGTVTADLENGGLDLETTSGNIIVDSIDVSPSSGSVSADVTLTSAGNITDSTTGTDSGANITASTITMVAATGIGATSTADIDTAATTLVLSTTTSGDIYVQDIDAVSIGATSTSSDGDVVISNATGDLTVTSAVTADGSGDITLNSAGSLIVNNVLTSTSGDLTLTGATGVTHNAAGDLSTGGAGTITVTASANDVTMVDGTVYTAGGGLVTVTAADEVLLSKVTNPLGAVTITATAGDISDETAAEGTSNENISGTTVTLSSATGIGASVAANDIDTAATTLASSVTGTGGIYITETDGVALGTTSTSNGAIELSSGGAVTTSGDITAAGGSLSITGVGTTNSNTITGDANGITLDAGTGTLTNSAGTISNGSTAGAINLLADTDIVLAGGTVTGGSGVVTLKDSGDSTTFALEGGTGTIQIADADLDTISTTGSIAIGDSATGAIEVGGALTLGTKNLTLVSSAGITLSNTIAAGAVTITNAGTLSVAAGGDLSLSDFFTQNGAGAVSTAGDITTTSDNISFATAVTLTGDVALDSDGGNISFASTIDGGQALSLDAGGGTIDFGDSVGTGNDLTSLVTTGTTGTINLDQDITTTGIQTYTGPVSLSNDPTLTSSANGLISFSSTVNGASSLSVSSGNGGLTFGSTVGDTTPLNSISTSGTTGTITLTGDVETTGTQTYIGPVSLVADSTLTTVDSLLTFSSTVDGGQALDITTGTGGVTFSGIVGSTPLTSLGTTNTTGTITIGNNITTSGTQIYNGPVVFNSFITLSTTGTTDTDDITFANTVTASTDSLDINVASLGDVTFGDGSGTDTVSGINALTTNANVITVNTPVSASSITFEGANASGDQLTVATGGSLSATGLITIGAANDTTEIENINLSGNITADSDTSGAEDLSFLSNTPGGVTVTFDTSGVALNSGTGQIIGANSIFAAGGNSPSFLSDGGVSWNSLTASGGTLTLAPVTASTAINVAGSGGYAISDSTLDGIANEFTKVTIGNSSAGSVTIGAGEALSLSKDWDLEIIGGASGSFVLGSANSVTLGSSQALILDSASVNITQTNELLGGGELLVKGSGDVTLTNASNNISRLAASNSGNLSYTDANDILVGTVDSVSDISVSGTVTLTA